jgi:Ca2+-binding EF-hand superfamily protein
MFGILLGFGTFGHVALAEDDADDDNAQRVERIFGRLDTNGDGLISREEAQKGPRMRRRFDIIDTDKDGYVSRAELKAFLDAHPRPKHTHRN